MAILELRYRIAEPGFRGGDRAGDDTIGRRGVSVGGLAELSALRWDAEIDLRSLKI